MRVHIHVPSQTLDLLEDEGLIRRYAISTSRVGLGAEPGSQRTPTGRFRIAEKIGDGAPPGEIFVSREPTGRFGEEADDHDHVQTRILWLEGLDPENANTFDRYIYIHGTNHEESLGAPSSIGCIELSNLGVLELFDQVRVKDLVWIED